MSDEDELLAAACDGLLSLHRFEPHGQQFLASGAGSGDS
jgi:hypothetical protein